MIKEIANHRSIRKYKSSPIDEEVLSDILHSAARASTCGNMQLYSLVVTLDARVRAELAPCHFNQAMVTEAPCVVTVCADVHRFSKWCEQRDAEPAYDNFEWFLNAATDALLAAENGTVGNAVIYYAFDNGVNSNRYPYYSYMKDYWNGFGLDTHLDMMVTVSDLKRMADYDLAILSAHGAYYTYEYGWLWKKQATAPILLLLEKSDFWNDLRYGMDLLSHRVIKVNGCYAVTGDFFRNAYRGGKLNGTIVLSETCEFYGRSGHVDTALSDGLLSGGAKAVAGFVNNVYSVYSRSMLWATVNRMIEGETLQQAIDYGLEVYGENDIVWYLNQNTGRRPHAAASYPII